MKLKATLLVIILAMILFNACSINLPVCATSNTLGYKMGVYTQTSILWFPPIANNDAATMKAALKGGITKITTVDYRVTWMIFVTKYETIVTGN